MVKVTSGKSTTTNSIAEVIQITDSDESEIVDETSPNGKETTGISTSYDLSSKLKL